MVGLRAFISVGSLQYSWPSFIRTRSTRGVLQSRTKHHMTMDQEEEPWTQPRAQHRRRPGGSRMGNHQDNRDCWKEPLIQVDYIPPDSANTLFQPSMLLLVGLPGSGKSTFSRSLVQAMPYKFARVNQDELQTRKNCVAEAKKAMANRLSVIVDRCNFDYSQRQVWYELAAEYHYPVDCVVLQVPVPVCIKRCQLRTNHETVAPTEASRVVNLVHRQWRIPSRDEQGEFLRGYQVVRNSTEFNEALAGYLIQK